MSNLLSFLVFLLALTGALGCCTEVIDSRVEPSRFEYMPDAELAQATGEAMRRLTSATGVGFRISEPGTRVISVEPGSLIGDDGSNSCAWTRITFYDDPFLLVDIQIEVEYPPREECFADVSRTIEHEVIHSVRRGLDSGSFLHSDSGLFRAYSDAEDCKMDDASLVMLCEAMECKIFNVEK